MKRMVFRGRFTRCPSDAPAMHTTNHRPHAAVTRVMPFPLTGFGECLWQSYHRGGRSDHKLLD